MWIFSEKKYFSFHPLFISWSFLRRNTFPSFSSAVSCIQLWSPAPSFPFFTRGRNAVGAFLQRCVQFFSSQLFFRPRWHARRQVVRPHLSLSNTRQKWVTLSNTRQKWAQTCATLPNVKWELGQALSGFVRLCHSPLFILGSLNLIL